MARVMAADNRYPLANQTATFAGTCIALAIEGKAMLIMVPSKTPISVVVITAAITRARSWPGNPSSPGWFENSVIVVTPERMLMTKL